MSIVETTFINGRLSYDIALAHDEIGRLVRSGIEYCKNGEDGELAIRELLACLPPERRIVLLKEACAEAIS
jgi:hypothetical protein